MPGLCSSAAHPFIAMFHVAFLIGVVFLFLSLPLMAPPSNAIAIVVVAGAIDFYFIKNIAGRKLIGMRWWVEISDEGY